MIRRDFIKISTLAAGSLIAPLSLGANQQRIKLAILGTGWWGTDMLLKYSMASAQFEIVGLCDVDSLSMNSAADIVEKAGEKRPQLFSSYEQLYAMPGLQAVAIATPTHWHALHFIAACKKGLHVFLEKPISYDIREGQAMLEAYRKAKNVVQVDFPRVMTDNNNQIKAYINSGELGKIYQVQANIHSGGGGVLGEKPVPSTFDFETFCGPAPKTKFLCYPSANKPSWRAQHDFSRGILADWGIHYIHDLRRVLGLDLPDRVSAMGGITRNVTSDNPDHMDVRFDFNGLPVNWTSKEWGFNSITPKHNIGVYYFGEKGTLFAGDLGWEVYPSQGEKITHGDVSFNPGEPENMKIYEKMMIDLFLEFAEGLRMNSNKDITNTLDEAQKTTSCVIYADLAYLSKAEVAIEKSTLNILQNEKARNMLVRKYRAPYQHPYKA